jgi:hypothetical protein
MATKDDTPPYVPRIGIKIRRLGEKLQLEVGNMKLKTNAIGNQEYDLVTIEQFMTKAASCAYQNIIKHEQLKADLKSLDWDKDESNSKTDAGVKDTLRPGE